MKFALVSIACGVGLVTLAVSTWCILPRNERLWKLIPRERNVGIVIGFVCLVWSAYHTYLLLDGGLARFRNLLPVLVVVVTISSYFLLDYLFSRSVGGFLLLLVNWLLHEAFVVHVPFRPAFAVICYIFGIIGIFLIATPYRFRDFLKTLTVSIIWRGVTSIFLCLTGITFILISFYQRS